MPYVIKMPDEDTRIAIHAETGARLYGEIAPVPLYVNIRLIGSVITGKRTCFRLAWIIKEQRLAHNRDRYILPDTIIEWIIKQLKEAYPNHAFATGLTDSDVAELEAEQKLKRKTRKAR